MLGVELVESSQRRRVGHRAVVVAVLAGEQCRPGGAAERVVDEAVRERDPELGEPRVDVAITRIIPPSGRRSSPRSRWDGAWALRRRCPLPNPERRGRRGEEREDGGRRDGPPSRARRPPPPPGDAAGRPCRRPSDERSQPFVHPPRSPLKHAERWRRGVAAASRDRSYAHAHGLLISFDEALVAEITDRDEIGDLVERAWTVRRERFDDSTDMCSLVGEVGGCAEDCGFCASRARGGRPPMHAMLEPEQILEHARAAEPPVRTASAWSPRARACRVAARLREDRRGSAARLRAHEPEALRVGRAPVRRAARPAQGRRGAAGAPRRRDRRLLRRGHDHGALRGPHADDRGGQGGGRSRPAWAASSTSASRLVGESRWRSNCPDRPHVGPINLLNPRSGTKFGDRPLMDPWWS